MIILLIALGILLIWEVAEFTYKKSLEYKKSLGNIRKFYDEIPKEIEIANIGSGPAVYGINYQYSDKKGFNFATAPQSFTYGFRLLKRFSRNISENAIVIIVIMCPMSFGNNNDIHRENYSDMYYGILPPEMIDGYSVRRALMLSHPLFRKVFIKIKCGLKNILEKKQQIERIKEDTISEPPVVAAWKRQFELRDLKDPAQASAHQRAFDEKCQTLQECIDFCRSKKWKPIMVIPPIPEITREHISREFIEVFCRKQVEKLLIYNPDVPLFDHYEDKQFKNNHFTWDIFLNQDGQEIFSELLFKEINEWEDRK